MPRMSPLGVSPEQVSELREASDAQLVDVRESYEWDAGRIAGARHIELAQVAAEAPSIDRERPVVFYCRVGSRSTMAADAFRRAGYDAYSLDGGRTYRTITPATANDGSFKWRVPFLQSRRVRVRVQSTVVSQLQAVSQSDFSIGIVWPFHGS